MAVALIVISGVRASIEVSSKKNKKKTCVSDMQESKTCIIFQLVIRSEAGK